MLLAYLLGLVAAWLGHMAIGCAVFNQLHATPWSRGVRKALEKFVYLWIGGGSVILAVWMLSQWTRAVERMASSHPESSRLDWGWFEWSVAMYVLLAWMAAAAAIARWVWLRKIWAPPDALVEWSVETHDLAKGDRAALAHGTQAKLLTAIRRNESFLLAIERKTIALAGLDPAVAGLTILHLSDLHFTGKIDRRYFERVVGQCAALDADLVCLTGDVVDERDCLEWIEPVLGGLRANLARLFVLGNHDRQVGDARRVRESLARIGFRDVAGQPCHVASDAVGGRKDIAVAGNEAPWFAPAKKDERGVGAGADERVGLRLLLAHSPDCLQWAERRGFDLVLAGHVHGGQIRLPLVGPIVAPSRHGVRFAGGTGVFMRGGTVMHVSRGVSADDPIRIGCPPEITLLTLIALPEPIGGSGRVGP